MVGIHARTAREKIGEGKIAHVMNDEPTRKFIQAVKVCNPDLVPLTLNSLNN